MANGEMFSGTAEGVSSMRRFQNEGARNLRDESLFSQRFRSMNLRDGKLVLPTQMVIDKTEATVEGIT